MGLGSRGPALLIEAIAASSACPRFVLLAVLAAGLVTLQADFRPLRDLDTKGKGSSTRYGVYTPSHI